MTKVNDAGVAELKRRAAAGLTAYDAWATEYGVTPRYIREVIRKDRRTTVGENVLAQTEPDMDLEEMFDFHKDQFTQAANRFYENVDVRPIHARVIELMSSVYSIPADRIAQHLNPLVNRLSVHVNVGEDDG